MTSWDAFTSKGFDAFDTPGFDARNLTCVPTTLVATGRYIWPFGLPPSPTLTLTGDVAFDSLGRLWATDSSDNTRPVVYDDQGTLLLTGPSQSGSLVSSSDAGQGRAVYSVYSAADLRSNKLVCFNADDATVAWTYTRSGAAFDQIFYASGIVFAAFKDHDNLLPGVQTDFLAGEIVAAGNIEPAWRTVAINADTGALIATADGLLRAVGPEGGLLVYHNEDDFLPAEPLPITLGDPATFVTPEYIRYAADLTTQLWSKSSVIGGQTIQASDIDETGKGWLLTADELISIDTAAVETSVAVTESNAFSWGVSEMAVDLCATNPRAFIRGTFLLPPTFTPRQSTIQDLSLAVPNINPNQGNFPSTIGGTTGEFLRINGKWSIFT